VSKGFQLFGYPRVKIRFEGEDGLIPEQRLQFENMQGIITRFYERCSQQRQLAEQPGMRTQQSLPGGGQLRYTHNHGQETVDVRLSPKKAAPEETTKSPPKEPWDFLLLDLSNPIWTTGYLSEPTDRASKMTVAVQLVTPNNPAEVAVDIQALSDPEQHSPSGAILFPGLTSGQEIGDETVVPDTQVASALLDLRPYSSLPVIEFDLFAKLTPAAFKKSIRAIIARHTQLDEFGAERIGYTHMRYLDTAALTHVQDNFPSMYAQVDASEQVSGSGLNSLIPDPYTTSSATDEILSDSANFVPTNLEWIEANRDIFDKHLWWENFIALWVPGEEGGGGDEWNPVNAWSAWQSIMDGVPAPAAGSVNFTGALDFLGASAITQKGAPFWFQANPDVDYFGLADPGSPPVDNYGGGSFLVGYSFAQVFNTYIYIPSLDTAPEEAESVGELRAAAFRGFSVGGDSPGDFRWAQYKPEGISAIYEAIGVTPWVFRRWELESKYPEHIDLGLLSDNVPLTANEVPENPGEGEFLGRITFTQEGGVITFRPASAFA